MEAAAEAAAKPVTAATAALVAVAGRDGKAMSRVPTAEMVASVAVAVPVLAAVSRLEHRGVEESSVASQLIRLAAAELVLAVQFSATTGES